MVRAMRFGKMAQAEAAARLEALSRVRSVQRSMLAWTEWLDARHAARAWLSACVAKRACGSIEASAAVRLRVKRVTMRAAREGLCAELEGVLENLLVSRDWGAALHATDAVFRAAHGDDGGDLRIASSPVRQRMRASLTLSGTSAAAAAAASSPLAAAMASPSSGYGAADYDYDCDFDGATSGYGGLGSSEEGAPVWAEDERMKHVLLFNLHHRRDEELRRRSGGSNDDDDDDEYSDDADDDAADADDDDDDGAEARAARRRQSEPPEFLHPALMDSFRSSEVRAAWAALAATRGRRRQTRRPSARRGRESGGSRGALTRGVGV